MPYNYYWDAEDPSKPFTAKIICNEYTLTPENATRTPAPENYNGGTIPCWDGEKWILKADWRQEVLYSTKTGKRESYPYVDYDEKLFKENFTTIPPNSVYDIWDGEKWVTDVEQETLSRIQRMNDYRRKALSDASEEIELIKDAIDYLDSVSGDTGPYDSLLKEWRKYRGNLVVLKIVTGKEEIPLTPKKLEDIYG